MPIPEKREAVDAQVEPRQETDVWVQDTGAAGAWKGKEGRRYSRRAEEPPEPGRGRKVPLEPLGRPWPCLYLDLGLWFLELRENQFVFNSLQ